MDSKDQNLKRSEFYINKTNPFLSISIHFRLLGFYLSNFRSLCM